MKRVVMVHGWGGSPENDWFPYLKKELEQKGFEVVIPEMPDTDHPRIEKWIPKLKEVIESLRDDDILIGHSIGCQAILRVLPELDGVADKVIMVAPWIMTLFLDENEEEEVAEPWLKTPIDFEDDIKKARNFIAIFSSDDPYVPFGENSKLLEKKLNAKIVKVDNMNHFDEGAGITELPLLLEYISMNE